MTKNAHDRKEDAPDMEHDDNAKDSADMTECDTAKDTETVSYEEMASDEKIAFLEKRLHERENESRENWDRFLRERADLENFRKRTQREKEELLNYGYKSLIEDILPVVDNMERALSHADSESQQGVVEGIRMTHGMLLSTLKKFGVSIIEADGAPFDPAFHQAMSQVERDDMAPNMVAEVFQKGYMIRERLLRPAMVAVSKLP